MFSSDPSTRTDLTQATRIPSTGDRVGVWIDTQKAFVIRLTDQEPEVVAVPMDMERHDRIIKAKHHGVRAGGRVVSSEKHEQPRLDEEMHRYLHAVMDAIGTAGRIVVFGPAYVKNELGKALTNDARFRNVEAEMMTADRMTPNQMVAWVKRYYKR